MTVIRRALEIATSDIRLCSSTDYDGFYSIVTLPTTHAPQGLLDRIKMLGSLCALSMAWSDMGPDPISPNLLELAIKGGAYSSLYDISFLQSVAPDAAVTLTDWPATPPETVATVSASLRYLISYISLEVCRLVISTPQFFHLHLPQPIHVEGAEQRVWDEYTRDIYLRVLLNLSGEVRFSPFLAAFRSGFDMGGGPSFIAVSSP